MSAERFSDHPLVQRNAVLRKGLVFGREPLLRLRRKTLGSADFMCAPPVFVNSLPKSGTHLLLQVTRALPGATYFGRFVAMSPSVTLRQKSDRTLARQITRVLPAETLGAHLHFLPSVAEAISKVHAVHLFIFRDPRDVVASEAYYLAEMNRWHRMHRHFRGLSSNWDRLTLALDGLDERYPEANSRFIPYAGWTDAADVVAIRYEDLIGPGQGDEIARVVTAWEERGGITSGKDALVGHLRRAIDPAKSHTFREGGSGKWRRGLSDSQTEAMTERLKPSLKAYGYL